MPNVYINRTISILYRYNQCFISEKLEELALPLEVGQLPTLMQIYHNPGITQEGISANACIDKGTVARTVKQLEDKGLVVREVDLRDKRVNHTFATEKAMEIKEKIFQLLEELHEVLYQGFSDSEIVEAMALLDRMRNNMEQR